MYSGDNNAVYPASNPWKTGSMRPDDILALSMGVNISVPEMLADSIRSSSNPGVAKGLSVFCCPSDPYAYAKGVNGGNSDCYKRCYRLNLYPWSYWDPLYGGLRTIWNLDAIPQALIPSPAGTPYLFEAQAGQSNVFGANGISFVYDADINASFDPAFPMHGVTTKPVANSLCFDGHVERIDKSTLKAAYLRYNK
jgi:hypothetical protein